MYERSPKIGHNSFPRIVINHTMGWLSKRWRTRAHGTPLEDWEVVCEQKAEEAVLPPEDAAADKSDEEDASPFAFLALRVRPQFWVRARGPAKTSSAHLLANSPAHASHTGALEHLRVANLERRDWGPRRGEPQEPGCAESACACSGPLTTGPESLTTKLNGATYTCTRMKAPAVAQSSTGQASASAAPHSWAPTGSPLTPHETLKVARTCALWCGDWLATFAGDSAEAAKTLWAAMEVEMASIHAGRKKPDQLAHSLCDAVATPALRGLRVLHDCGRGLATCVLASQNEES